MVRQMASSARVPLGIALSFVLALSTLPVQALAEATDAPQAELEAEALEVVDNEALAEEDELSAEDATEKAEEPELTAETQPDESPETDVEDEAALIGCSIWGFSTLSICGAGVFSCLGACGACTSWLPLAHSSARFFCSGEAAARTGAAAFAA